MKGGDEILSLRNREVCLGLEALGNLLEAQIVENYHCPPYHSFKMKQTNNPRFSSTHHSSPTVSIASVTQNSISEVPQQQRLQGPKRTALHLRRADITAWGSMQTSHWVLEDLHLPFGQEGHRSYKGRGRKSRRKNKRKRGRGREGREWKERKVGNKEREGERRKMGEAKKGEDKGRGRGRRGRRGEHRERGRGLGILLISPVLESCHKTKSSQFNI